MVEPGCIGAYQAHDHPGACPKTRRKVVQITANRETQDVPRMLSAVPLAVMTVTSCVNEDAVLDLALDEIRHICIRVLGLENDREGQPGLDVAL